jgi:hypothetical protein
MQQHVSSVEKADELYGGCGLETPWMLHLVPVHRCLIVGVRLEDAVDESLQDSMVMAWTFLVDNGTWNQSALYGSNQARDIRLSPDSKGGLSNKSLPISKSPPMDPTIWMDSPPGPSNSNASSIGHQISSGPGPGHVVFAVTQEEVLNFWSNVTSFLLHTYEQALQLSEDMYAWCTRSDTVSDSRHVSAQHGLTRETLGLASAKSTDQVC